ncbi:MarR family winged helix-turn-helix transcriptional regulator [Nocardia sp. NPDC058518]|uniref:MarR family winged helix-turn-helix transcriptional regulator n=1 Tax=Nocardia sp. NPDC058518 TaxID=3346534 RepID=UPI003646B416
MNEPITAINEHLRRLHQLQQRPGYRRRLLDGIDGVANIGTLRILRATERAEAAGRSPSVRDIAHDLGIEHSTASRAVNETTRLGLTERHACDDDQRRARIELTERGHAAADRATRNRQHIIAAALTGRSDEELEQLDYLLGHLIDGLARLEDIETAVAADH